MPAGTFTSRTGLRDQVFTSFLPMTLLTAVKPGDLWQELGSTPGKVVIPVGHSLGVRIREFNSETLVKVIQDLAEVGSIRFIDFSLSPITDDQIEHLRDIVGLTGLSLQGCNQITDNGLERLRGLKLAGLNLYGCERITDNGLAYLTCLKLTRLVLGTNKNITDDGLAYLPALKLTSLGLKYIGISDAGLVHVSRLTRLTDLSLEGCSQITDVGLEHLRKLFRLKRLNLDKCRLITNEGLAHLACLVNLTRLSLGECTLITDAGLDGLYRPGMTIEQYDGVCAFV